MSEASDVASLLKSCGSVLITVHRNPDGDALGSEIALMLALEKLKKKVTAQNADPVPEMYRFLPVSEKIRTGTEIKGPVRRRRGS